MRPSRAEKAKPSKNHLRSTGQARLRVWHWYRVGDVATGNPVAVKLLLARQKLFHLDADSAAIAIASVYRSPSDSTLEDFVRHLSVNTVAPPRLAIR